ncbi:MAG: hypothetical protein R2695_13415 [Acidimicrobiales bacterium]
MDAIIERIRRRGEARAGRVIGRAGEEIADPAGESLDVYRATATRLDRQLGALAAVLRA